jgi:hypothetical protein
LTFLALVMIILRYHSLLGDAGPGLERSPVADAAAKVFRTIDVDYRQSLVAFSLHSFWTW